MKIQKNLVVLGIVMLVNALSYGTIIPLLYPYAAKFGISTVGLSFLFVSFSLAQFVATPIIGRLSDSYGRKPLLLYSLFGTSVSLFLFGIAWSLPVLFVARILDGITGGNISVAQAAIADSVEQKKRAQAFGILGAAFGIGFILGPALGGFLGQFGLSVPFYFASALALTGTLTGLVFFEETLVRRETAPMSMKLINLRVMGEALLSPHVGKIFWVSVIFLIATNAMIIGFQTTTVDVLSLNTTQVGILFAMYGVVAVLMQVWGIRWLIAHFAHKRTLVQVSLVCSAVVLMAVSQTTTVQLFTLFMLVFGLVSAPLGPVLTALLSERSNPEDQGGMLGINQSFTSLSQIIGPLAAGFISHYSTSFIFIFAAVMMVLALVPAKHIGKVRVEVDL